ncbi:AAA-domain-containing protein [Mycena rebaudengoi]|nr:AAA-domain-containing protein [Mycena rebaudengoi]
MAVIREGNLDKAIEIVQRAIELDLAQKHRQACKDVHEKNEQFKTLIRSKINDYLHRAETLKGQLSGLVHSAGGRAARYVLHTTPTPDDDNTDPEIKKLRAGLTDANPRRRDERDGDDIAGLEGAKAALKEAVIVPIRFPALFTGARRPWKGILLYGPPGDGQAKSTFFSISSSDLVSKWQGDSEKLVKHLFQMAREMKPAIIFIDEIDSMTGARGDGDSDASRRLKTEFLVQMDGVGHDDTGVLVIGATNIPWQMDLSIKRRKRIYIPLPSLDARHRMFELHVGATPCELIPQDFRSLAEKTEGYSGADISIVVQDALMQPIRKFIAATHFKRVSAEDEDGVPTEKWMSCSPGDPDAEAKSWTDIPADALFEPKLTLGDFTKSLASVRPTVVQADIERHAKWTEEFGNDGS